MQQPQAAKLGNAAPVWTANVNNFRNELPTRDPIRSAHALDDTDVKQVRERLARLGRPGGTPLGALQRLIADSAYWYGHEKGPVRAPKHLERIQCGRHGMEVEFGANKFLVERAVQSCRDCLAKALFLAEMSGRRLAWSSVRGKLEELVRLSVANHVDERFTSPYPAVGNHMLFGTQSINVRAFVDCLYEHLWLQRVCSA